MGIRQGPGPVVLGMLGKLEARAQQDCWFYLTATLARGARVSRFSASDILF